MKKRTIITIVAAALVVGALAFLCRPIALDRDIDWDKTEFVIGARSFTANVNGQAVADGQEFKYYAGSPEFEAIRELMGKYSYRLRLTDLVGITGGNRSNAASLTAYTFAFTPSGFFLVCNNGQFGENRYMPKAAQFVAAMDDIVLDGAA